VNGLYRVGLLLDSSFKSQFDKGELFPSWGKGRVIDSGTISARGKRVTLLGKGGAEAQ